MRVFKAIAITLGLLIASMMLEFVIIMVYGLSSEATEAQLESFAEILDRVVSVVLVIGTIVWARKDAAKIELEKYDTKLSNPNQLLLGLFCIWFIVFPWYLVVRDRIRSGEAKRTNVAEVFE